MNKIPNFDPTQLPFWDIYLKENPNVKIGGTMAGEFTAGLSGGQRKMLLFELIYQRTANFSDLLICLDEPFAGVTDDFLPYLTKRVTEITAKHNLLLVTNDHVQALTSQADNVLTVSAVNRDLVTINATKNIDRELALYALSNGNDYVHENSSSDLRFFLDVEVFSLAGGLGGVMGFTIFAMIMLVLSYWDTQPGSEGLALVGVQIIAFFCINPYLIALSDWRNFMTEESEALMHASVNVNKALKTVLTLFVLLCIATVSFGVLNLVMDGDSMAGANMFNAMFWDSASLTFPFLCTGLYTNLPFQAVQIISSLPFLFMIFFSTTFSPGAGLEGVKFLRFLFSRFYFWYVAPPITPPPRSPRSPHSPTHRCKLPGFSELMEGCPSEEYLDLAIVLSGALGLILFLLGYGAYTIKAGRDGKKKDVKRDAVEAKVEFKDLQTVLFGDKLVASPRAGGKTVEKGGFTEVALREADEQL